MEDDPNESFLPIGPRPILTAASQNYGSQFARVKRLLERLEDRHRGHVEYEDDMFAFFLHCWHLKDWVNHDDKVPEDKRKAIWGLVGADPTLQLCRFLATGTKHLSPQPAEHKLTVSDMTGLGAEHDGVDLVIALNDGRTRSGYELAHACVEAWETIFAKAGVTHVSSHR
jgi:hypothetical protein